MKIKQIIVLTLTLVILTFVTIGGIKVMKLVNKLKIYEETTLVAREKTIDSLQTINLELVERWKSIDKSLENHKATLKRLKELNAELIKKTKEVYIPELHGNRTSRELLSDLEKHRKYIFISDTLNN